MKSARKTQAERTALARAKLVEASAQMIAESGVRGFVLTQVGGRAGVSRALANYHFKTRGELIAAVFADLLAEDGRPEGLGLAPLLTWISDQAQRAASQDPRLLALLQLAVGPGVHDEAPALRKQYWEDRTRRIANHLTAARTQGEIRNDLELRGMADVLLGLLHGELLRIAATGANSGPAFRELIEGALGRIEPRTGAEEHAT